MFSTLHENIFLVVDSVLVGLLYAAYKHKDEIIKNIVKAPSVSVGPDLEHLLEEKGNGINYAIVRGKVQSVKAGDSIQSPTGLKGVLQIVTVNEHSVKRHAFGHWGDTVQTLQQTKNSVPFGLKSLSRNGGDMLVEVSNPYESSMENLLLPISTNFSPTNSTMASTVMGFFTGHASKGFETTEELLPVDTVVTGIGRLTKDSGGNIYLSEPENADKFLYILSTLPAEGVVKRLESRNFYLKLTTYILFTVGMIIVVRRVNSWWKVRREAKMRERILNNRKKKNLDNLSEAETCIICLANPREILLMDCGHVAVCADCCSKLNRTCPICRNVIRATHAAYIV